MNKKIITTLLLSATIFASIKTPVFAHEQPKNRVADSYKATIQEDHYVERLLGCFGYPFNGITYNFTSEPVFAGTLYHVKVYADGIFLSGGNIDIRTHGLGSISYTGINQKEVNEVSGKQWKEKVKLSFEDAVNHTKNYVYKTTKKNITQEDIKIEELSLVKVNGNYAPYYSIKVTFKDTDEKLDLLLNAENADIIKSEKVI